MWLSGLTRAADNEKQLARRHAAAN